MKQLAFLVVPLLLATPVQAAKPGTIGYVDMQQVLDKSKMGKQATETLKKKFEGRQQELAEEEQSIRQLQQTLARDQALMSQEELDKKTGGIQKRIQEFKQKVAQAQRELAQEQNKLGGQILEPARTVIAAVARDKQISAVFERHQSGLLYIDEGLDLTAEVVKRLDARKQK